MLSRICRFALYFDIVALHKSRIFRHSLLWTWYMLRTVRYAFIFCTFVTGNSKSGLNFLPTAPKLRATLATSDKSYKDHLIENVGAPIQFQPRNANQIKYYKESNRRICKDSLLALHEFAYMIAGFVWSITTFPDLVVVCGFKPLIDFILPLCANEPILLSYDTTFNLGDFCVSILCMQQPFLTSKPCIPLAFMIHERKFKWMHDHFFRLVRQNIPHLTDAVIAVDGEASISNAIRAGTDWKVTMCANHILRDIEFWLKKHSASAGEIPVYKSNVGELLHCHNASALSQKELNFKSCWSAAFVTYYTDHLAWSGQVCICGLLAHPTSKLWNSHNKHVGINECGIKADAAMDWSECWHDGLYVLQATALFVYRSCPIC